jgi:hypothetical protein
VLVYCICVCVSVLRMCVFAGDHPTQSTRNSPNPNKIPQELDAMSAAKTRKCLLLGAGEAGKSTLAKQLDFHYNGGNQNKGRLREYHQGLKEYNVRCMTRLLKYCVTIDIVAEDDARVTKVYDCTGSGTYTEDVAKAVESLWADEKIKQTWFDNKVSGGAKRRAGGE